MRTISDATVLTLDIQPGAERLSESSVRFARLSRLKAYIEDNLGSPRLSPGSIAKHNGISIRYLHRLFQSTGVSASEWIWQRRLQRCHDMLIAPSCAKLSITDIAYAMGFSSSSHFSNLFREHFGMRPSDLRRPQDGGWQALHRARLQYAATRSMMGRTEW